MTTWTTRSIPRARAAGAAARPARRSARRRPPSARLLFALLARLRTATLHADDARRHVHRFGAAAVPARRAPSSSLHDWRIAREVLTGGDVAFAEAYMDGRWDTPDLTALLTRARGQPAGAGARVLRRRAGGARSSA